MRKQASNGAIAVQAIAGTYVVLLGMDIAESHSAGVLGFAIERTDHTENERYWLRGFKTFAETDPGVPPGSLVSTLEHPVQAFLWGDFTAKPHHDYTYRIVALRGKPKNLEQAETVEVRVQTEDESRGNHAVYFNRGVAGSQAYARRFGNQPPGQVPHRQAWRWLSRGLEEAMLSFIRQAKGKRYGLRAAVYEFQYQPALIAFAQAAATGAEVKIIFDGRPNSQNVPNQANRRAITDVGIEALTLPREENRSYISHNKFIILLENGEPTQVWTGSTNFTMGGIFGQSNVGHIVRDRSVATQFMEYWLTLSTDPPAKTLRSWNENHNPVPVPTPLPDQTTVLFSPRSSLEALEWYAQQVATAKKAIFFTAAFGVSASMSAILTQPSNCLRYVLLEKEGGNMESLRRDPNNRIAVGGLRKEDAYNRVLRETLTGLNRHVRFVHTKYLLIDPLSDNPLTITGSANFSNASTKNNDENMLLIQGDKWVADIYLGEFIRLFNHYYYRYVVQEEEQGHPYHLTPDDTWLQSYYRPGTPRYQERLYFAGIESP